MKKKFNAFLEKKGIKKEDFETMSADKIAELYSEFISEQNEELEKMINEKAPASQVAEFKAIVETMKTEHVQIMADINAMKEKATSGKDENKSTASLLEEKKEALSQLKTKKGENVRLTVKAAATMTTANVTAVGGGLSMILNQFEGGITPLPRSAPFFADLFAAAPTSGNTISYAEMKNPDGGAGMTGEGSAKTKADFDIVEAKTDVKKITSFIKTSKEALDDIQALAGEINNELLTLVNLKKDSQVMSGDGTGNNLKGALEYAEDFTGGSLAGTIVAPNNYDVLVAAITEIATAEVIAGEPAGFMANVIVLNPVDVAAMKLTKDKNDNYIFPVQISESKVMEVPVVANARMTVDNFLVMDSSKGNLRIREGVTLDIGYENDDFTKNLVTILAEMRLAFYVKSQHTKAFVTGTFAAAKALLQTV